jgi:fatty-acyl-CoA synthase
VTEAELCDWASERVPERAAAPKTVTVLDALPVTTVGKPYKLALRADAAERELTEALAGVAGVRGIDIAIEDGSITATVTISSTADETAVKAILHRYAMPVKVHVTP